MIPKVFVIDDDEVHQLIVSTKLKRMNISQDIKSFSIAQQALEALKKSNKEDIPDVIFLDINMPTYDGWDFLEDYLKISDSLGKTPLIYMLTSSVSDTDVAKANTYPIVSGYLVKPLKDADLKLVEDTLSKAG
jgi:CheY-like chemotaxis protein